MSIQRGIVSVALQKNVHGPKALQNRFGPNALCTKALYQMPSSFVQVASKHRLGQVKLGWVRKGWVRLGCTALTGGQLTLNCKVSDTYVHFSWSLNSSYYITRCNGLKTLYDFTTQVFPLRKVSKLGGIDSIPSHHLARRERERGAQENCRIGKYWSNYTR